MAGIRVVNIAISIFIHITKGRASDLIDDWVNNAIANLQNDFLTHLSDFYRQHIAARRASRQRRVHHIPALPTVLLRCNAFAFLGFFLQHPNAVKLPRLVLLSVVAEVKYGKLLLCRRYPATPAAHLKV